MADQNTIQLPVSPGGRSKIITGVILALAVTIGAASLILRTQITTKAANFATVAKTERVLVGIEGMHCTGCASGIKSMLKRTGSDLSRSKF